MSWSNNNRAHACLWFFEKWHLDRKTIPFVAAGNWQTSDLIKAATNDSVVIRENKARAHAQMLDDVFTSLYRAKYEEGISQDDAIESMFGVLNSKSKKMKDLGDPVDLSYKFLGEV